MTKFTSLTRIEWLFLTLLILSLIISMRFALKGDLYFHTDIARDFLLVQDIISRHTLTLIGPRAGGISGVFHGPLWIYMMIPAYLIGKGDPAIIAWYWIILNIISITILMWVAHKLFKSKAVTLLSGCLLAMASTQYGHNLFNPFGAVILSPLFVYFLIRYFQDKRWIQLATAFLILGLMFQFQMAFAGPVLILTIIYIMPFLYRNKLLKHFWCAFILLIPLATFILFEIRHDWLQLRSVVSYLNTSQLGENDGLIQLLGQRLKTVIFDSWQLVINSSQIRLLGLISVIFTFKLLFKDKMVKYQSFYHFLGFIFIGYWIITILYKGQIWSYYYWPFSPLIILFVSSGLMKYINYPLAKVILSLILVINTVAVINSAFDVNSFSGKDGGSWIFFRNLAADVYRNADDDFGYYIYTPDQHGYSPRYAMDYLQTKSDKQADPYQKRSLSYLIIAPIPKERPDLTSEWWKTEQVKVTKMPEKVIEFENDYRIERYTLTPDEIQIPSDPNLITNLHFR